MPGIELIGTVAISLKMLESVLMATNIGIDFQHLNPIAAVRCLWN